jgi:hypothetical protein
LGRPALSESESKQLLAAWAWRVRASAGQIPRRKPSRPHKGSGSPWLSNSTRRTFCTRQRPGSFG